MNVQTVPEMPDSRNRNGDNPLDPRSAGAQLPPRKIRLGEELPIFCEKCGYALHGLPQSRSAACDILQFHCPECAHHQPINTLRPAFQKLLGRVRAAFLVFSVLFKINFFGWLLVAWFAMGVEFSYTQRWTNVRMTLPGGTRGPVVQQNRTLLPQPIQWEDMLAFSLFGLAFGMFGRMLLLRWGTGYVVGFVLAALVALAISLGASIYGWAEDALEHPFTRDFTMCIAAAAVTAALGASIVWGVWYALVTVFLPKRSGQALLDWQQSLSNRPVSELARE
jgi:hypothetical protein